MLSTLYSMPMLFLNLAGEMVYILDQRLQSQKIGVDKSRKVLGDIIGLMFTSRFIDDLFRPQSIFTQSVIRTIFERLAHSSIMSLGKESMDKLFDLMMMVFKYQLEQCRGPAELLALTLNHLQQTAALSPTDHLTKLVRSTYDKTVQLYGDMDEGELQDVRFSLMNFFQDYSVRVSIFLRSGAQKPSGTFTISVDGVLPNGVRAPGVLVYFDGRGEVSQTHSFPVTERVHSDSRQLSVGTPAASLSRASNHGTQLGLSIYSSMDDREPSQSSTLTAADQTAQPASEQLPAAAVDSLQLLGRLIGQRDQQIPEFKLSLFSTASSGGNSGGKGGSSGGNSGGKGGSSGGNSGVKSGVSQVMIDPRLGRVVREMECAGAASDEASSHNDDDDGDDGSGADRELLELLEKTL